MLTRAAPDVEGGAQPPRLQVDAGLSHGCTGMRRGLQRHRRTFTGPGDAQVVQTRRLLAGRGRGRRLPAGHGPGRRLGCTGGPTLRVVGRAAGGNAPERQHGPAAGCRCGEPASQRGRSARGGRPHAPPERSRIRNAESITPPVQPGDAGSSQLSRRAAASIVVWSSRRCRTPRGKDPGAAWASTA